MVANLQLQRNNKALIPAVIGEFGWLTVKLQYYYLQINNL